VKSKRNMRSIRIDDRHAIQLRVTKWFPTMAALTILLAIAGSFFYGDFLTSSSSFTAGVAVPDEKIRIRSTAKTSVKKVKPVPTEVTRKKVAPRIIGAETKLPNIKLELESTSIVGNSARVTYRIYNTGAAPVSGSTWAIGEDPNQPLNKQILPWRARTFTRKTASFPLSSTSPGEFKIYVSDDVARAANSYTVRF